MTNNTDKFRILALHGHLQNGELFRKKTGSFRKIVKSFADFVFVTAPHKIVKSQEILSFTVSDSDQYDQYGWWYKNKKNQAVGFDESVKFIEKVFKEEGPFDGLFAFSRGACFASLLCSLLQRGEFKENFKFVLLFSGYKSKFESHDQFYKDPLNIPSMHVYGEVDDVIKKEQSEELQTCFSNVFVSLKHDGGHYVPGNRIYASHYKEFFTKCQLLKQ